MPIEYLTIAEAIARPGLRLILSPGVPGPWSVAAKAIFDLKRIPYVPVAQPFAEHDQALRDWTGQDSAPVAMLDEERPRTRWYELLQLAERLGPEPRLIPIDEQRRAEMFGLLHSLCGEDGFGWNFRLQIFSAWDAAAKDPDAAGGFVSPSQLAMMKHRYGDPSSSASHALERMRKILGLLAGHLVDQRRVGSAYFVGATLTAMDVYWVAFSNLIAPIAQPLCPMIDAYRTMCEITGAAVGAALDPILLEHRDLVISRYLTTPLEF